MNKFLFVLIYATTLGVSGWLLYQRGYLAGRRDRDAETELKDPALMLFTCVPLDSHTNELSSFAVIIPMSEKTLDITWTTAFRFKEPAQPKDGKLP